MVTTKIFRVIKRKVTERVGGSNEGVLFGDGMPAVSQIQSFATTCRHKFQCTLERAAGGSCESLAPSYKTTRRQHPDHTTLRNPTVRNETFSLNRWDPFLCLIAVGKQTRIFVQITQSESLMLRDSYRKSHKALPMIVRYVKLSLSPNLWPCDTPPNSSTAATHRQEQASEVAKYKKQIFHKRLMDGLSSTT